MSRCLWCLSVAVLLLGCGGDAGPRRMAVDGTVSLDGQPLPSGLIRFIPTGSTKGPAAVGAIKDGAFSFDAEFGPVLGAHRVEIEAIDSQGLAIDDEQAYAQRASQTRGQPVLKHTIPAAYNVKSILTKTVTREGPNTFDFQLDSKEK